MKQLIVAFILCLFVNSTLFCQEYVVSYPLNNGYTLVYKKLPASTQYQNAPEKTYGVINSENKIVVPLVYKNILNSGEKGVFIVKPGFESAGLFSAITQKMIVEPQYYDIESFKEGLAVVKIRKPDYSFVWGAIDVNGNVVIPVEYDYIGVPNEGLMPFRKEKKLGYIDKTNKIIIPAMYSSAQGFSDGLAGVQILETGKYGYINKNNKLVIAADYEDANPFYGGFAAVAKKKGYTGGSAGKGTVTVPGQWVVIDKTGKLIHEKTFDKISSFYTGGLFIIETGNKKGVMDSAGAIILPIEYTDITIDKNGYIIFKNQDKKYGLANGRGVEILKVKYDYISPTNSERYYSLLNGKYETGDVAKKILIPADSANGVLLGKKRVVYHYKNRVKIFDLNGNLQQTITDLNLNSYGHSLTETEDSIKLNTLETAQLITLVTNNKKGLPFGEAGDFNDEGIFIGKNSGYDFYNYTGKKLNAKSYYSVVNFSEGVCALQETSTSAPHLADKNFNKIKDLYTYFKGPYSEGMAYATNTQNGIIYYLDKKGYEAFNVAAKEGSKCTNGFITIADKNNRFYHVNKKGVAITNKTWDDAGEFYEGLASVKENGKWGFIDTLGKKVIETRYDALSNFSKGAAIVKLNNEFFLVNKKGEPIDNSKYEAAGNPGNGTFPVQKNKLAGLIDSNGKVIVDFKYNSILYMSDERVWAAKDGKWGLLDNKGKPLTEFIYQGAYDFKDGFSRVMVNDKLGVVNKSGKLILPAEYKSIGTVYKNTVIAIRPAENIFYSLK